ncbi:T4-like virus tail tube protein gp19 (plasmid) [Streptomyces sp. YIM 121038]|uniref:phage tail protein n=1 Tax=Streptomyces sp. YIM 121038 TaxID=2136401 RepID=UPI00110FFA8D|nr:phage tail protein [Streptomyces sp. YIM 121038]QCX82324.1 T4-like virus tail tube protein gp19 [Streptomyces sp. YIM 121038]
MSTDTFAAGSLFRFSIGMHQLGSFTSCEGLSCYAEIEERREGGLHDRVSQLPGRLRYSNLTLSRPLTHQTTLIWAWLQQVSAPSTGPMASQLRLPGQLVALGPDGRPLVRWVLDDVMPVRWSGPSFSADQPQAAYESLEIVHNGFLEVLV